MEHLMKFKSHLLALVLLLATPMLVSAQSTPSSGPAATPAEGTQTPPEHPITQAQLHAWMQQSLQLDASMQHIQDGLDQTHKTFPPWFPDSVWADVKQKVAQIDLPALALPVYQRYFSEQDGAALLLLYQGPTGQEYARVTLQSRLDAIHQGLEGSAAEAKAMQAEKQTNAEELRRKRIAELTPEERQQLRALESGSHRGAGVWRTLDDDQNVLIQKKANEVLQATLKAHNTELLAAKRAYEAKHPPSH